MNQVDAIVIAADMPQGVAGKAIRDSLRLTMDGHVADLRFLERYFLAGRDTGKVASIVGAKAPPALSINGPYLCQFLEDQGLQTALIPIFSLYRQELEALLDEEPRAVVISTTFLPNAAHIDSIAAFVKERSPKTVVIAGGIKIWKSYKKRQLLPQGWFEDDVKEALARDNYLIDDSRPSPVDYLIVSSSGEETLAQALLSNKHGEDVRALDNVAFFDRGQWWLNPVREEPSHDVRVDWSRFPAPPKGLYTPVQAGIGCRFRCAFCDFWDLRHARIRPMESIIEEIRTVPEMDGVRRVNFTDDNLFTSRKHVRALCQAIKGSGMKLKWRGFMRVSVVTEEIAEMLAEAGCMETLLGIESGDAQILKQMQKGTTPEQILSGMRWLNHYGIDTESTLVVGFPGETAQSVKNTIDVLNAYETGGPGIHRFILFRFSVFPLSVAASPQFRKEFGIRGYLEDWRHNTMDAAEAAEQVIRIHNEVKVDVTPVYLDLGALPRMSHDQRKRAFTLRNRINLCRRGLLSPREEAPAWDELEALVLAASDRAQLQGRDAA